MSSRPAKGPLPASFPLPRWFFLPPPPPPFNSKLAQWLRTHKPYQRGAHLCQ